MKNRTIFACEGSHDVVLLKEVLIEKLDHNKEDISFYSTEQKRRKSQSSEIYKFMSPYVESKRFLVKDEGGKKRVEAFLKNNITTTFLNRKFVPRPRLIAIVDSDMGVSPEYGDERYKENAESFISRIGKSLSKPIKIRSDETQTFKEALMYNIQLENSEPAFHFHIIFVKQTLEQRAKITEKDSRKEIEEKISDYVKKGDILKLFESLDFLSKTW